MIAKFLCVGLLTIIVATSSFSRSISPLDYGLLEAKTDVERYNVLYATHADAIARNCAVSYSGIKSITVEITKNAKPIPLPRKVDFAGVTIVARNNSKNAYLFSLESKTTSIEIDKRDLSRGDFHIYNKLKQGRSLLIIEDENLWVERRKGYNYGVNRKDIMLIKNGTAQNTPIQSYLTPSSNPSFSYCAVSSKKKKYKDLFFKRTQDSKYKSFLFKFENQYNIVLSTITVITPPSDLYGDNAILFSNCANVSVEDLTINGTYSLKDKFGYGITLDNVYNASFIRLKATANWGVFGNNNINSISIQDSAINRFDIHCYGKDVSCTNTVFKDLYNQFSSFYGTLSFENCQFIHFVPVLFEWSYNAYSYFDLIIRDCIIEVDPSRPYLINSSNMSSSQNSRPELATKYWPNIYINGLKLRMSENVVKWYLFKTDEGMLEEIHGIENISIENVSLNNPNATVYFSSTKKALKNKPNTRIYTSDFSMLR